MGTNRRSIISQNWPAFLVAIIVSIATFLFSTGSVYSDLKTKINHVQAIDIARQECVKTSYPLPNGKVLEEKVTTIVKYCDKMDRKLDKLLSRK